MNHQYHECPRRQLREQQHQHQPSQPSWADIVLKETVSPQPALVRPPITDIQEVDTKTARDIQHKLPRQGAKQTGKQSQADTTPAGTASSIDKNEDGMQTRRSSQYDGKRQYDTVRPSS
jgi:hypothetical protein